MSALGGDGFLARHVGPSEAETEAMLRTIGVSSVDALIDEALPPSIRLASPLPLPDGMTESAFLTDLRAIARKNVLHRSYIGLGYYGTVTPSVILRNVLENPGWYTPYKIGRAHV